MDLRPVTDRFAVAPQIEPTDLAVLAGQGFRRVINNRPDGEAPGQPPGAEMAAAAQAAGLDYVAIPVSPAGFQMPQVGEMATALSSAEGKTLAFCRSGTRSIMLWALAQAQQGRAPDAIASEVEAAGYSAQPIMPTLEALSRGA